MSGNEVRLTWEVPPGIITGFRLERSTDGGTTWPLSLSILDPAAVSYNDTTVQPLTPYAYRIFATSSAGDSPASNVATVTTPQGLPQPPNNLAAVAVSGIEVRLTWVAPAGPITGFRIERSTNGGATWPFVFSLPDPVAVSYNDITVQPLTTYAYRAFATSVVGNSAASNIATVTTPQAPPAAPSNLTARLNNAGSRVILNWRDNSNNENAFLIERKASGGVYAVVAQVARNIITYTDSSVQSNTTYQYQVRAFRTNGGPSLPSNEVSITVGLLVPIAPANLRVTRTNRRSVNLAWQDLATNERGVYVERSTNGVTFTRVLTTAGRNITTAQVNGLSPNTPYYFRVQYYNTYGGSLYSNVVTTTTLP